MTTLRRLCLILPMLSLPAVPAGAGELSASQGLEVLAMAKAADSKCAVLSRSEQAELAGYEARAEMAALTLLDKGTRSSAIAKGTARGRSATCSDSLAREIRDTLVAARQAVALADHQAVPTTPETQAVFSAPGSSKALPLAAYTKYIKPYYADLRCRSLSKSDALAYWKSIVRMQKGMIAEHGQRAVIAAQAKARRVAGGMRCSSVPAAVAGLASITNR